jgi:hypothetical protein
MPIIIDVVGLGENQLHSSLTLNCDDLDREKNS